MKLTHHAVADVQCCDKEFWKWNHGGGAVQNIQERYPRDAERIPVAGLRHLTFGSRGQRFQDCWRAVVSEASMNKNTHATPEHTCADNSSWTPHWLRKHACPSTETSPERSSDIFSRVLMDTAGYICVCICM